MLPTFRAGIISELRVLFPLSPNSTLLFFIYCDHRCLYSSPQPPAVSFRKILKQYIPIVALAPQRKPRLVQTKCVNTKFLNMQPDIIDLHTVHLFIYFIYFFFFYKKSFSNLKMNLSIDMFYFFSFLHFEQVITLTGHFQS